MTMKMTRPTTTMTTKSDKQAPQHLYSLKLACLINKMIFKFEDKREAVSQAIRVTITMYNSNCFILVVD